MPSACDDLSLLRRSRSALERAIALGCLLSGNWAGYTKGYRAGETYALKSVARTMRCSTVDEHDNGLDHECTPSEIRQDAGLD